MLDSEIKTLLENVQIAKVLEVKSHPNADRLVLALVQTKNGERKVVTGASNFKKDDFVAFLDQGNIIPGYKIFKNQEIILKEKELRGIKSDCMLLAPDEIGLQNDHSGLFIVKNGNDSLIGKNILEALDSDQIELILSNYQNLSKYSLEGLKSVTQEIIGEDSLKEMLINGENLNHYIGFEISGLVHVGTGLCTGLVIKELQKLGIKTRFFLADWHTWINEKLEGDWEFIKRVAKEYFSEMLKISAKIVGADPNKIEIIYGSELYHNNDRYWKSVLEVSKNLTLSRVRKSTVVLGREDSDSIEFAKLIYPPMQVADIFEMQNSIIHSGTDQRKCHVIAREVATKIKINPLKNKKGETIKPVAIHHTLLSGLQTPTEWPLPPEINKTEFFTKYKMSKSIEGSAIFMNDSEEEIKAKIKKAFCPEKEIEYNPILNWTKNIILPIKKIVKINRENQFGGNIEFDNYSTLEKAFAKGEIHPVDLKNSVAKELIDILKPAREFCLNPKIKEIIGKIKSIKNKR